MNSKSEIAQLLKKKREERGISVQDASEALRIRKQYLTAIEDGNFDEIPGKAYISGYVKMYAEYLGISDQIEIMQHEVKQERIKVKKVKKQITDNWVLACIFSALIIILLALVLSYDSDEIQDDSIAQHLIEETLDNEE